MFEEAMKTEFNEGTSLTVTFTTGEIKRYDMKEFFKDYPQYEALKNRKLFLSGKAHRTLIVWNDELDVSMETIYEDGELIGKTKPANISCYAVQKARANADVTQKELAKLTGLDQGDISKIERGLANPTVETLEKIAKGLGKQLRITIE